MARGLTGRGHEVHVYAAYGSENPGVEVIDTGVDPQSLAGTLYRAFGPSGPAGSAGTRRPEPAPAEAAFARAYASVREIRYDVIHNHAFDAPDLKTPRKFLGHHLEYNQSAADQSAAALRDFLEATIGGKEQRK